jgi:hypothetical protein
MKTIDDSDIIASNCARYFVQKETNESSRAALLTRVGAFSRRHDELF